MRLFPSRVEKELDKGNWGFWRWYDIVIGGELYLTRLTLLKMPWFSIKLHWIHKADPDRDLHDHPWSFRSFVLRGWYEELSCEDPVIMKITKKRRINWFNSKTPYSAHRITKVSPNLLTLVVTGHKQKSWGFYDEKTFEYTDWRTYCATKQGGM